MPAKVEAPIPEDLQGDYQRALMQHKGHRGYAAGLIERIARLEDAIYWSDGQRGDFRERGPREGAYWWRHELMKRAGLRPVGGEEGEKP